MAHNMETILPEIILSRVARQSIRPSRPMAEKHLMGSRLLHKAPSFIYYSYLIIQYLFWLPWPWRCSVRHYMCANYGRAPLQYVFTRLFIGSRSTIVRKFEAHYFHLLAKVSKNWQSIWWQFLFKQPSTQSPQSQRDTGGCTSENHFARHTNHSYTDLKQSRWNLVCGILCLNPNTKRNFSSFGPVFSE